MKLFYRKNRGSSNAVTALARLPQVRQQREIDRAMIHFTERSRLS